MFAKRVQRQLESIFGFFCKMKGNLWVINHEPSGNRATIKRYYCEYPAKYIQRYSHVDVYLAELTKLTVLFGGLPERALAYKFLAGLPTGAKQLL